MEIQEFYDVVVVGGGHGGAHLAAMLRQLDFGGSIAIVTDDAVPPYQRPPLSKDYLAGAKRIDDIWIRPPEFWTARDIAVLVDRSVVAVDPIEHLITTSRGEALRYGRLAWAAGGAARRWRGPGGGLHGFHSIRSVADVDTLTGQLARTERVCIIGGGYIGLESAAALRSIGMDVTVLELEQRVLARVAGLEISDFFETEHRRHGVDLRTGVTVAAVAGVDGAVASVKLDDGSEISCEMVVVGMGIDPVVAPLRVAGADVEGGIVVDAHCLTSLTDVYALGDCAMRPNRFADGRSIRLESVHNATDQANIVARHIGGLSSVGETLPWFWSHQYDHRLQTVGLSRGHDQTVVRRTGRSDRFSVIYLQQGRVLALDCVNSAKDYAAGRSLVTMDVGGDLSGLGNPDVDLKSFVQERHSEHPGTAAAAR